MSRCFGYPPPGYLPKQPLIESIKLQKDIEKAKEERRKERKREKKDKKRKREAQSSSAVDRFGQGKVNIESSRKLEKQIVENGLTHGEDISSDVTEEHEQPVCVVKPSYSSKNSQNSNKKRQHESSANASGSILNIRLPSLKKKETDANTRNNMEPSTTGRTDPIGQDNFGFGQRFDKWLPCSTSTSAEVFAPPEKQPSFLETQPSSPVAVSKSSTRKLSEAELLYKTLLESLVSPTVGNDQGYGDEEQDWLLKRKFQKADICEKSSHAQCSLDSNVWPRAQFFPSADLYALPFVVPF